MLTAKTGGVGAAVEFGWRTLVDWHRTALAEPAAPDPSTSAKSHEVADLLEEVRSASEVDQLVDFIGFSPSFRRHSIFNTRLIHLQRPGARAVATASEWKTIERWVLPDAIPIVILWPFAPVIAVYDVEDTGPRYDRAAMLDPFMALSALTADQIERAVHRIRKGCASDHRFRAEIVHGRFGFDLAAKVALAENAVQIEPATIVQAASVGDAEYLRTERIELAPKKSRYLPHYRITISDRLTPIERLVTLCHELGHILCGHLGASEGEPGRQPGWPDRSGLSTNLKEIEAEAVAWLVASRALIVIGSAEYLKSYVVDGIEEDISFALVERAASHVENMTKLDYALDGPSPDPI